MEGIDIELGHARIGKYHVIRRLGEGASSEVFLCHDDFLQKEVAVKRVRSSALTDSVDHR